MDLRGWILRKLDRRRATRELRLVVEVFAPTEHHRARWVTLCNARVDDLFRMQLVTGESGEIFQGPIRFRLERDDAPRISLLK